MRLWDRVLAPLVVAFGACGCAFQAAQPQTVELRVIAFNDFHGHLEPPAFGFTVPDVSQPGGKRRLAAGGVAHLAAAIGELKRGHVNRAVVAAGDLVGASPLVSSLFLDEPSVDALSAAGLELSSLGNHEFDRGRSEIERLQHGGCAAQGGCLEGEFRGARFQWLAANVFDRATGATFFPPYAIRHYDGIAVAFVGAVLRGTPKIVSREAIAGLEFRDEADSVNALVPQLRAMGIEAIVLLIHEGGRSTGAFDDPACPGFQGPIVDIVRRLDPAVDVVVSGHTHEAYLCRIDGRLVTSAGSYGRLVTAIDLTLDRSTRDVVAARAANIVVEPARFPADAALARYVARVAAAASGKAERPVGTVVGEISAASNAAGESSLGDFVADAQLAAMRGAGARIAFANSGGLRAPLASRHADHSVTFADLYAVQPFGNHLVALGLTGAQIVRLLEQQWRTDADRGRILQVSSGFRYAWDRTRPVGSRVVPGSVTIDGDPLRLDASYRVVVNSFLAGGGDDFAVLAEGTEIAVGPLDVAALEDFLRAHTVTAQPPEARIERIDAARR